MSSSTSATTFFRMVRMRTLLYWNIAGLFSSWFFAGLLPLSVQADEATMNTLFMLYFYGIAMLWIFWHARKHPEMIARFFVQSSPQLKRREWLQYSAALFCTIALSIAGGTLLGLLIPGYKEMMLVKMLFSATDTAYPFFNNVLGIVGLVIFPPLVEEVIFRSAMLQRWGALWGMRVAILLSSFFFCILHFEPFGAFLFGIIQCLLYLRTGSLRLPIMFHFINNALLLPILLPQLSTDFQFEMTTSGEDLIYLAVFLGIAAALFVPTFFFIKEHWPKKKGE